MALQGPLSQRALPVGAEVIEGIQGAVHLSDRDRVVSGDHQLELSGADPTIVGIISLRGTIVTIIDVRRMLRELGRLLRCRLHHDAR